MQALKDALETGAATVAWSIVHSALLEQQKLSAGSGDAQNGDPPPPSTPRLRSATGDALQRERPRVILDSAALWRQFYSATNEMIVTKAGRRMFPVLKLHVSDLDSTAQYALVLEFRCTHQHRWRFLNGNWQKGSSCEDNAEMRHAFVHFASIAPGSHWMQEPVSFAKLKLSNRENGSSKIKLNSLHKYQPYAHLIKFSTNTPALTGGAGDGTEQLLQIDTFTFTETQFIAVTAYQNDKVTQMKIKNNPFAKAFLGGSSTERAHNCTYLPSLTMGDALITRFLPPPPPPPLPLPPPVPTDLVSSSPPPYETPYTGLLQGHQTAYFQYHQGAAIQGAASYSLGPQVHQQHMTPPPALMSDHYPCLDYSNGLIEVYDGVPGAINCYHQAEQGTFPPYETSSYYSPPAEQFSPDYLPKPPAIFPPDDETGHTPHSATPTRHTPLSTTPSTSSSTSHSPPAPPLPQPSPHDDRHQFFFLPFQHTM